MANEILTSFGLYVSKGGMQGRRNETLNIDMTGDTITHEIQNVGTSEEELAQGADLGTPGVVFIKNLDTTNYVEIGCVTGQYTIKLKAGEACMFRAAGSAVYAVANTAACDVEYFIIED